MALTLSRATRVKNKNPAPVQITAEQILREARKRQEHKARAPPKQKIADSLELTDYAHWEEQQGDLARARSVYERAIGAAAHRDHALWVRYAEFEMRNRSVGHARNVWDRAVALLPHVDQLCVMSQPRQRSPAIGDVTLCVNQKVIGEEA